MKQPLRSVIAFLVSPLIPIFGISMSLAGSDDMLEILPFVAFFAYMLTVFIALPLYGVMRYKKWLTWGHFALFGALLGMGAGVAFWAIAHRNNALIASTIFSPPSKP